MKTKRCFLNTIGQLLKELTIIVTACTRPEQDQARQNPSVDGRGDREVLSQAEELLVIERSSEWESQFSSGLQL